MNTFLEIMCFGILRNDMFAMAESTRLVVIVIGFLLVMLSAYLLGSINFAILISGKRYHEDIRTHGSKNAGMTNMMRTYGKKAAAMTLLGDAFKAVVAILIGYLFLGQLGADLAALFCVIGHMFPIFFHFRGGKGVVTVAASILMTNPVVFVILLLIFAIIVLGTKYISLGSIMCMLFYPLFLKAFPIFGYYSPHELFAVLMALLVIAKHYDNIRRLWQGKENKFSFKKSKPATDTAVAEETIVGESYEPLPEGKAVSKKKNLHKNYEKKKK